MPVSQVQANELLAEFIAKRGNAAIPRFKSHVRGPKPDVNFGPDSIEKASFEPDNSRIGENSRGLQSESLVSRAFRIRRFDLAARAMVQEYHESMAGIPYRLRVSTSFLPSIEAIEASKPVGCETKPAMIGNWFHDISEQMPPVNHNEAKQENRQWLRMRKPRLGQRVAVLLPR